MKRGVINTFTSIAKYTSIRVYPNVIVLNHCAFWVSYTKQEIMRQAESQKRAEIKSELRVLTCHNRITYVIEREHISETRQTNETIRKDDRSKFIPFHETLLTYFSGAIFKRIVRCKT